MFGRAGDRQSYKHTKFHRNPRLFCKGEGRGQDLPGGGGGCAMRGRAEKKANRERWGQAVRWSRGTWGGGAKEREEVV